MADEQTHNSRRIPWGLLAGLLAVGLVCLGLVMWQGWPWGAEPVTVKPPSVAQSKPEPRPTATPPFRFTDVTAEAGITFTHEAGAQGNRWYPETIGSGVAFFDYDGDRLPDILLVNSTLWPGPSGTPAEPQPTLALYRNRGDGTFEDVTRQAGMAVPLYGMGVAAAD